MIKIHIDRFSSKFIQLSFATFEKITFQIINPQFLGGRILYMHKIALNTLFFYGY